VPVDINTAIRRLMPTLVVMAGENVRVRTELPGGELTVLADKLQIEQVLMNLCSNARDAMPGGGTFTIKAEPVVIGSEDVPEQKMAPGRYALVTVDDTGTGMDEATKERIFEPFFTTKEVGKGTGLGLSIVFGIMEQLKGHIEVSTEEGEGTVFMLYLPLLEKSDENPDNKTTS